MNRRTFLKLFIGTVAVATVPIPNFLLPKEKKHWTEDFKEVPIYPPGAYSSEGSTLTQEMIEDAAARSAMNMGQPDMIFMSKSNYKKLGRYFGYKVIYRG